jgi:hypothetical protein
MAGKQALPSSLRGLVEEVAEKVVLQLYAGAPPLGTLFEEIEEAGVQVGDAVACAVMRRAVERQAAETGGEKLPLRATAGGADGRTSFANPTSAPPGLISRVWVDFVVFLATTISRWGGAPGALGADDFGRDVQHPVKFRVLWLGRGGFADPQNPAAVGRQHDRDRGGCPAGPAVSRIEPTCTVPASREHSTSTRSAWTAMRFSAAAPRRPLRTTVAASRWRTWRTIGSTSGSRPSANRLGCRCRASST